MTFTTRPPNVHSNKETLFFEQQKGFLLEDISVSFERVLANVNKLNRSLEGIIAVGHEFSSVEALWSQFENVMAEDSEAEAKTEKSGASYDEKKNSEEEVHNATTLKDGQEDKEKKRR